MGTTLTGTTPQDTYDSLIKVTDNGPIGTSLKTLTDGLGNDSALALSSRGLKVNQSATLITDTASLCHFSNNYLYLRGGSAGLSIGDDAFSNSITLVDAGSIVFEAGSAERMRITSAGNVGIGTSNPLAKLHVAGENIIVDRTGGDPYIDFFTGGVANSVALYGGASTGLRAFVGGAERIRVTTNGLTFNGDTAAANALDDYEEGTFTATITGGTFSGLNSGVYTKIGRQVYWYLSPALTAITGNLTISGLPFTNANRNASVFANVPPAGVTYLPAFHNSSSASCDVNVSGTYSGAAVSTYFAGVYSV